MIEKGIIALVISENYKANQNKRNLDLNDIESLKATEEKSQLFDYISNLPKEDLIDLVTIMDIGRDIFNHENDIQKFIHKREEIAIAFKDKTNQEITMYLLGKGHSLSRYLSLGLENL